MRSLTKGTSVCVVREGDASDPRAFSGRPVQSAPISEGGSGDGAAFALIRQTMASMSPNPFVTPLPTAIPPVVVPPVALAIAPASLRVGDAPKPASTLAGDAPKLDAGPFPAIAMPASAAGDSRGSLGAWTDTTASRPVVPLHPESTGSIRDALLKIHRARLSRIVKGVVGVSAFVCLVALGRAAVGGRSVDAEAATIRTAAATMRSRDAGTPATVQPAADTLTSRTADAINGVVRVVPARPAPAHRHKRH